MPKTLEQLEQDYADMLESLELKNEIPEWFHTIYKDILNKSISLDEWNSFINYVKNNSSDIKTVTIFINDLYEYVTGTCATISYVDSADTTLQNNIDAEELARQTADNNLKDYTDTKVKDEKDARELSCGTLEIAVNAAAHKINLVLYDDLKLQAALDDKNNNTISVSEAVDFAQYLNPLFASKVDKADIGYIKLTSSGIEDPITDEQANEAKKKYCTLVDMFGNYYYKSDGVNTVYFERVRIGIKGTLTNDRVSVDKNRYVIDTIAKTSSPLNNISARTYADTKIDEMLNAIKNGTTINNFSGVESALALKENTSNKVTSINSSSTDTQYPSAKCVYNILNSLFPVINIDSDDFSVGYTLSASDYAKLSNRNTIIRVANGSGPAHVDIYRASYEEDDDGDILIQTFTSGNKYVVFRDDMIHLIGTY